MGTQRGHLEPWAAGDARWPGRAWRRLRVGLPRSSFTSFPFSDTRQDKTLCFSGAKMRPQNEERKERRASEACCSAPPGHPAKRGAPGTPDSTGRRRGNGTGAAPDIQTPVPAQEACLLTPSAQNSGPIHRQSHINGDTGTRPHPAT